MCQRDPTGGRDFSCSNGANKKLKKIIKIYCIKCHFYTNGARGTMCKTYFVNNRKIVPLYGNYR